MQWTKVDGEGGGAGVGNARISTRRCGLRNPIVHGKYRPTGAIEVTHILAVVSMGMHLLDIPEARRSGDQ